MIYLDTNILIYAFCKNVDNQEQKNISQNILKSTIAEQSLLLSEISLYEFAFVSQKLKESTFVIEANLDYLSKYVKVADISNDVVSMMNQTKGYKKLFKACNF